MVSRIPGDPEGKVYLNSKGMRQLLKSEPIFVELLNRMKPVQMIAGARAEIRWHYRPSRVVVQVVHGSNFDEANTGNLRRALDLAGGRRGRKGRRMNRAQMRRSNDG